MLCKRTLRRSYIRFRSIQHFQLDYRISRSWRQQGSKGCKKKEVWAEKKRPTTEAGRPCSWVGLMAKHATRRGNRAREFGRRDAVCFQSLAVLADCGRLGELGWPPDGDDGDKDRYRVGDSLQVHLSAKNITWWWLERGKKSKVSRVTNSALRKKWLTRITSVDWEKQEVELGGRRGGETKDVMLDVLSSRQFCDVYLKI